MSQPNLEKHFNKLAKSRQHGKMDDYVELQQVSIMVLDVTKRMLVVLFVKGLSNPLKGLIKALNPISLQKTIKRALNLEDLVTKSKFYSESVPSGQHEKPFHKAFPQPRTLPPMSRKMEKTKIELQSKKL